MCVFQRSSSSRLAMIRLRGPCRTRQACKDTRSVSHSQAGRTENHQHRKSKHKINEEKPKHSSAQRGQHTTNADTHHRRPEAPLLHLLPSLSASADKQQTAGWSPGWGEGNTNTHTCRHTDKYMHRQAGRQADRQTHTHTHTQANRTSGRNTEKDVCDEKEMWNVMLTFL